MRAELYRIERIDPGALSIMARPRGGDWLTDEIRAWQEAGVDVIVSLLTLEEQTELGLDEEASLCAQHQLVFWSLPIPDRALPGDASAADRLIEEILAALNAGKHVAVHCRMALGAQRCWPLPRWSRLVTRPCRRLIASRSPEDSQCQIPVSSVDGSSSMRPVELLEDHPRCHLRTRPNFKGISRCMPVSRRCERDSRGASE
jgi:Polymorphic toxin system, DSP-PTPase phosphatase